MSESEWLPIDDPSCPRDGTPVDLWIEGADSMVDFYSPTAAKVSGKPLRHGRAADVRWERRGLNPPNWYPLGGLGYPLSPEVTPTHFRRHTAPSTLKPKPALPLFCGVPWTDEMEAEARRVYEGWFNQPGYVPWVERGNSDKQTEARRSVLIKPAPAHPAVATA